MRKIPKTITEEELIKILLATKNKQHKTAYTIAFYQALRVGEVVKLKPENIKKDQHIIEIVQSKGAKDRNITIVKPLQVTLKTIFMAFDNLPLKIGIRALQIAFKKKAKEVLNKDLHFHCLRHSGASWLLNKKKWDVRQVQQFLGHSKIQTTEIYTHVSPKDLIELEWGEQS